ncbi:hypothetical protein ACFTSF_17865 [Kribbella sp. NPDC056951]|uniref:hypothetical protein n=1 Tax=Kribbella sp. NPDC056951 TaxID=3345978 RepID=UPI003631475A
MRLRLSRQTTLSLLAALAVAGVAGLATTAMAQPAVPRTTVINATDVDGDALPDDWERNGYDANGDGIVDVDLPAMGASPDQKDLFVEVDHMAGFLGPIKAFDRAVEVYANAPVSNPNGSTGIRLHVDLGPAGGTKYNLGGGNEVPYAASLDTSQVFATKATHQTAARAAVFHYFLYMDRYNNGCGGYAFGVPGDLAIVAMSPVCTNPTENTWTGVFIHEFGHLLGLHHGGPDAINFKPNYLSVMNYAFSNRGVLRADGSSPYFGYQESALPPLNETSLSEPRGLGTPSADEWRTIYECPSGTQTTSGPAGQPIDWNCDGDTTDTAAQVDLNNDGQLTQLNSYADWYALKFGGGAVGDPVGTAPRAIQRPGAP